MDIQPTQLNQFLRSRRSIFPKSYIEKEIPEEIILEILENANWAPTHKKTEPWRFKVFTGEGRKHLSEYLANWYKENTPEEKFIERKFLKAKSNPLRSACVIALCMQRDPAAAIPEWEELAALACAVQNMWLSCHAYQIGCYWSSPRSILEANSFLKLDEGESCYGLLYMGYYQQETFPASRKPIQEKVIWHRK